MPNSTPATRQRVCQRTSWRAGVLQAASSGRQFRFAGDAPLALLLHRARKMTKNLHSAVLTFRAAFHSVHLPYSQP